MSTYVYCSGDEANITDCVIDYRNRVYSGDRFGNYYIVGVRCDGMSIQRQSVNYVGINLGGSGRKDGDSEVYAYMYSGIDVYILLDVVTLLHYTTKCISSKLAITIHRE